MFYLNQHSSACVLLLMETYRIQRQVRSSVLSRTLKSVLHCSLTLPKNLYTSAEVRYELVFLNDWKSSLWVVWPVILIQVRPPLEIYRA